MPLRLTAIRVGNIDILYYTLFPCKTTKQYYQKPTRLSTIIYANHL